MRPRLPILSLTLAAFAGAVHVVPGASEWLQFDRAALARGEWWRWLTAHVAHFGVNHLMWDVAVLLVLGWTCERASSGRAAAAIAVSAPGITAAVWCWQPQFETYRGLSGIDCALFGLLATTLLRKPHRAAKFAGGAAFVAVALKCGFELSTQTTLFADARDYAPVPLAHVIGLLAGAIAALPRGVIFRSAASSASPRPCP